LGQYIGPIFKGQEIQRQNRAQLTLPNTVFLFGGVFHHVILCRSTTFQKPALFPFSGKEASNLLGYPQSLDTIQIVT